MSKSNFMTPNPKFDKERQHANLKILRVLYDYFNDNPSQRFCQGLSNLGILNRVQKHMGGQNWDFFYTDEANTESTSTLTKVQNAKPEI